MTHTHKVPHCSICGDKRLAAGADSTNAAAAGLECHGAGERGERQAPCALISNQPQKIVERETVHDGARALHAALNFDYKTPVKQTEPAQLYFSHCCYANGEAEVCRDGRCSKGASFRLAAGAGRGHPQPGRRVAHAQTLT